MRAAAVLSAMALTGCAATIRPPVAAIPTPPGYRLVWNDEFDRPGRPDPTKWTYATDRNPVGWGNGELQYYSADRPENARVERGVLVIEARREPDVVAGLPGSNGQAYSSARIRTPVGLGWTYGFFEVRAKLPCGRGSWPAIWLLPASPPINWPVGGEIDVMEHVGYDPHVINAVVHTGAHNHRAKTSKGAKLRLADVCGTFHDYQLRWSAERIEIGVDGNFFYTFANDGTGQQRTWPFDKPFGLILNIAIGGKWGGQRGIDDSAFPQAMEVDYVRVFDRIPSSTAGVSR